MSFAQLVADLDKKSSFCSPTSQSAFVPMTADALRASLDAAVVVLLVKAVPQRIGMRCRWQEHLGF
jgi:hypothetical protein